MPEAPTTRRAQEDPAWVRWLLITAAASVIGILVIIPVFFVFVQALKPGFSTYFQNLFQDPDTWHSIKLTLTVAPIAVAANLVFGLAAAWLIARFRFRGRTVLTTLIDMPFSVSPVVAGLLFILIFGLQGYFGPALREDGYRYVPHLVSVVGALLAFLLISLFQASSKRSTLFWTFFRPLAAGLVFVILFGLQIHFRVWPEAESLKIIFATPGLILATAFVTFPFVARELIPTMEALGDEEDLAAVSLGASGFQMFWKVTLPNIKWGLLYGVILCNARAMGEFGAVYVVSGHVAGQTDTMPLRVEKLFQEYNLPGAFAVASLLTLLALVTLILKALLEKKALRKSKDTSSPEL
jgi:sulfate/thiosulfate transport system permease protein